MDINMCNSKGQTVLFICNVPEAIQAMIDADIDIHHLIMTVIMHYSMLKMLKQWNFVSNGINVNHRNKSGTLRFNILMFHRG